MTLFHPFERGQEKTALSGDGDGIAEHMGAQADARFFRAILMALAITTLLLGTAAMVAMP